MSMLNQTQKQRSGGACLGKGCMLFSAFCLVLIIAFVGGTIWAVKQFQNTYSATTKTTFPELTTGWQQGSADNTAEEELEGEPLEEPEVHEEPQPNEREPARMAGRSVEQRWRAFEKAADRHEKARIQLTDRDINTLLQNDPKLRGKAQVTIQENVGHVKVSIPMSDILGGNAGGWAGTLLGADGRFFNGQATVRPSRDGDPAKAQISNITIAGQSVPDEFLDRRFFGFTSVRGLITDWLQDQEIERFEIRNNRVIAETRGR